MPSIEGRLTALSAALQRRQMEQDTPVDGLSRSLFDLQRELAALNEIGKSELLAELNQGSDDGTMGLNLTMQDIEYFIADCGRKVAIK